MRVELEVEGEGVLAARVEELVTIALATAGVDHGHLAVTFTDAEHIAALNAEHRGKDKPTDVLSFPIDGTDDVEPRELGDVVICPEYTVDLEEAVVHGVLHLVGMDHETDAGEMLALQDQIMDWVR